MLPTADLEKPREFRFLARDRVYFIPMEGDVVQYQPLPLVLQRPLVIYGIGNIEGRRSGRRSGLILDGNKIYKIKGCRPSRMDHNGEPEGGLTYDRAQREISYVSRIYSILESEGIPSPLNPVGMYKYPFRFNGRGQYVAPIFEILGDIRLDEFMHFKDVELIKTEKFCGSTLPIVDSLHELCYLLGVQAGSSLRIINNHNITWSRHTGAGNGHLGNFVMFEPNSQVTMTVPVDFDASKYWRRKDRMAEVMEADIRSLIESARRLLVYSDPDKNTDEEREVRTTPYRKKLTEGLKNGYRKPDIAPIPTIKIEQAVKDFYELMSLHWEEAEITNPHKMREFSGGLLPA